LTGLLSDGVLCVLCVCAGEPQLLAAARLQGVLALCVLGLCQLQLRPRDTGTRQHRVKRVKRYAPWPTHVCLFQELPVQSAICVPANGAEISGRGGEVEVGGYAWSGGGRGVVRVDVSADGGRSWVPAALDAGGHHPDGAVYGWTLWRATLPLPPAARNI